MPFDAAFVSPLRRARQTAARVWGSRPGALAVLPALREVDLYSLQGVVKTDAASRPDGVRLVAALKAWKADPAGFLIDGHAPVRELWHRASRAWQDVLAPQADAGAVQPRSTLLVRGTLTAWAPVRG